MKILKIKFSKYWKKEVYQSLQKSKTITDVYSIHNAVLYINSKDLETVDKIFNRLLLNYKII